MITSYKDLEKQFDHDVFPEFENAEWKDRETVNELPNVSKMALVHFGLPTQSEGAISEMKEQGMRPATISELLAYAEKYPDEQRKYPIVALGSETVVGESRRVACLWGSSSGRNISMDWIDDGWNADYRFLAVRKSDSTKTIEPSTPKTSNLTLSIFIRATEAFLEVLKKGE